MDKQGELGDVNAMAVQELVELLTRQQKLLQNRSFLSRLPDKGQKIEIFALKLKNLIKGHQNIDEVAEMLQKMNLTTHDKPHCVTLAESDQQNVPDTGEKSSSDVSKSTKAPFKPSQALKSKTIPKSLQRPAPPPSRDNGSMKQPANRPVEHSNVVSPLGKFEKAKVITVEESLKLLTEQQMKCQELQAQQASEKLTERMDLMIGDYTPRAEDTYRDPASSGEEDIDEGLTDLIDEG